MTEITLSAIQTLYARNSAWFSWTMALPELDTSGIRWPRGSN